MPNQPVDDRGGIKSGAADVSLAQPESLAPTSAGPSEAQAHSLGGAGNLTFGGASLSEQAADDKVNPEMAALNFSQPLSSLHWGYTAPSVIDVYFAPSGLTVNDGFGSFTTTGWSAYELGQAMLAFNMFENVANVTFNQTANIAAAEFVMFESANATGALGYWAVGGGNVTVNGTPYSLDGWGVFNSADPTWSTAGLAVGAFGYITLIHEIGHGLGLAHPHDTGGVSTVMDGVTSAFGDLGTYDLNQGIWTTMTYNDGWWTAPHGGTPSGNYGYQGTPMTLDIAVLQAIYGANTSYNTGNNTYTLPTTNGAGTFYQAIWDAGGTDTIVNPGNANAVINLNDAPLTNTTDGGGYVSYVTGIHGGFTIADGAVIENATTGSGNDTLIGNNVGNTLQGNAGADWLEGRGGNDSLLGGAGPDTLLGGSGNDSISGGSSTDQLFGGSGADTLDGGEETDVMFVDQFDIVTDNGTVGYDKAQINDPVGVALSLAGWSGVERVNGFTGNDAINATAYGAPILLFGDGGNDTLTGSAFNDTILGGDGDDSLVGGNGNDTILGGTGNDTFDGGNGSDIYYIGESGDTVNDSGAAGFDKAIVNNPSGIFLDVSGWSGVERIVGYSGNDTITSAGSAEALTITGGDGDDQLTGGSAGDTFYAGNGADTVSGGGGADALIGGNGADELDGGAGNDFLLGGADADTFVFNAGFGQDVVKDFTDGVDLIDFSGHAGVNSLADLQIVQSGNHTLISLTAGGGDLITLADVQAANIGASDFIFL